MKYRVKLFYLRNISIFSFAFFVGFCGPLRGEKLSSAEIIRRAGLGRVEFIKVASELQGIAPQLTSKTELYEFILLLPKLNRISKDLDFDSWGGSPVGELSFALTHNALKWISFRKDSTDLLKIFLEMSEPQTRYMAAHQQSEFLKRIENVNELIEWNEKVTFALKEVVALRSEPYVLSEYEQLQAETVQQILKSQSSFSSQDLERVFQNVSGRMAAGEVLGFIQKQVGGVTSSQKLFQCMVWLTQYSKSIGAESSYFPVYLQLLPGTIFLEALGKMLVLGESPSYDAWKQMSSSFLSQQWAESANLMLQIFGERSVSNQQIEFVFSVLKDIRAKMLEFGALGVLQNLEPLSARLLVSAKIISLDAEGIYDITTEQGSGTLILSTLGNGKYIVALTLPTLASERYLVDYGFFQVNYNSETDSFEAHRFAQGSPIYPHRTYQTWDLNFKIALMGEKLSIDGELNNNQGLVKVKGIERFRFSPLFPSKGEIPVKVSGTYQGQAFGRPLKLTLVETGGGAVVAELHWDFIIQSFNYGYINKESGQLVLTTGEMDTYKWAQIKGQFLEKGGEIHGFYFISGDKEVKEVKLKRTR